MSNDELARIERIVNPASHYLAQVRAREFMAVASGDLESAEDYHQLHQTAIAGLRKILIEWQSANKFPNARRQVRQLLASYA